MTCFVAIIDPNQQKITYSNASHNPPLLLKKTDAPVSKNDLHPLLKAMGPRLGHKIDGEFTDETTSINTNDLLILFTDGIIEATSPENKAFGQRNFFKSLISHINLPTQECVDKIIGDVHAHTHNTPYADDVTLVMARISG